MKTTKTIRRTLAVVGIAAAVALGSAGTASAADDLPPGPGVAYPPGPSVADLPPGPTATEWPPGPNAADLPPGPGIIAI